MRRILKSVEDCAKIADVAIQHNPEISSLVWPGTRFMLMVGRESESFLTHVLGLMGEMNDA